MRAVIIWLAAALLGLALCGVSLAAKATRPKVAAVVVTVGISETRTDLAGASVVGGYVKGRGWLDAEKAGPVMKKGDRLALYMLQAGHVSGEVILADNGEREVGNESYNAWGWSFTGSLTQPPKGQIPDDGTLVGVWHAPGGPRSRWVTAKELSPENHVYASKVATWLKSQGLGKEPAKITQIVQADLNGDGRNEVLISFHSPDPMPSGRVPAYSFLIMRHLPRGSSRVKTEVLTRFQVPHFVLGLCDLDGDGWAEVIAGEQEADYQSSVLYHWNGRQFKRLSGTGGSC